MDAIKENIGNVGNIVTNKANELTSSLTNVVGDAQGSIANTLNEFSNKGAINAGNDYLNSNSIVAKFVFLILVFIIFIFICNLGISLLGYFTQPSKTPYIIYGMLDGTNALVISQDPSVYGSIPVSRSNNQETGMEFTWSSWLLLSSNSSSTSKPYQNIFNKGDSVYKHGIAQVNNGPGLYLSTLTNNENTLHVIMDTVDPNVGQSVIDINGVPFNKWFHVTIRLENKVLDVYINGTISSRQNMKAVPKQNYNDINICQNGGFNGQISNLRYFNYALSAFEINRIVMSGPNLKVSKLDSSKDIKRGSPYFLSSDWYTSQR
jgi:hypothetical protein